MTRIIMHGCGGRMGQVISSLCSDSSEYELVAGLDISDSKKFSYPVYSNYMECEDQADVIIDFSHPSAIDRLLKFALKRKLPLLICTTGISPVLQNEIVEASKEIPILLSANTTVGVNLLIKLVQQATKALYNDFDIEIVEKHHNQKVDAPSGTALAIAEAINDACPTPQEYVYDRHSYRKKRSKNEIGIHAIRGGAIVGEHTVIFAGEDEIIEIKHTSLSKNILGIGALKTASFLKDKPSGFYSMNDILDQ